jgi:DNA invertase Pin-like site-specific DNA recombinase
MRVLEKTTQAERADAAGPCNRQRERDGPCSDSHWSKLQPRHLERLAIVYVRQSTPQQVVKNRESTDLQYKLSRRAERLGWPADRVVVVDEDLGQTACTVENRLGFQWLMAEVSLNHVGIVFGIEMTRLARSNKDWHQLLELCAIFDTLLADQDRLYDPADYSDRLLLGLTGIMSEAELHILRKRMMQGKRNKAERGELFAHLPRGFVRTASGGVAMDADEQVQAVMRLFFEKFEALGSGRKLLRWLLDNEVRLPVRPSHRPDRGELQWRRATPGAIYRVLHHPMYAGAYSYGRHPTDPRRKVPGRPGSGKRTASMDEWQVLKKDHLPAYISWEQYLSNLRRLAGNASRFTTQGAVREGEALLGGLVACGRCGYRMMVVYNEKVHQGRYVCRASEPIPGLACQSVQSKVVDRLVGGQVLRALEPAALELSLKAAEELDREYQRLDEHWQKRWERAAYEAERARRQYHAVEPENRLVARELEKRWEEALCEQREVEEAYARFQREQTRTLATQERERILSLSSDIAALWEAPSTTPADRKTILRCLVERVDVHVPERGEAVEVTIHWAGGFESHHETERPVGCYEQLRDFDRLRSRILELREAGESATRIASRLNEEGFHPPRGKQFRADTIRTLLSRRGISRSDAAAGPDDTELPGVPQWSMSQLVEELQVPWTTLCHWCRRGWLHADKTQTGRWRVWADAEELARLRRLRDYRRADPSQRYPAELATPQLGGKT